MADTGRRIADLADTGRRSADLANTERRSADLANTVRRSRLSPVDSPCSADAEAKGPCCRGIDLSSQEVAGLQAEREGLKNQLSALQNAHAEAQQCSQREADRLTKVHVVSPSSSCNKPRMAPFLLESLADLGVGASTDLVDVGLHKLLSDASQRK